jgi:hypothetical protein
MNEELQEKLYQKYPEILSGMHDPIISNHSPIAYFGVECEDGWYSIIDSLCSEITKHLKLVNEQNDSDPDLKRRNAKFICKVVQIKEKFGGLRFYIDGGDDHIYKIIEKAENTSLVVCEYCGSITNVGTTSGWIRTICEKCYNDLGCKENWKSIEER